MDPNWTQPPLAVSPAEAARLIGICRTRVFEALGSGELASFKIGKRRLIRVSAIEAWIASHEGNGPVGRGE